MGYELAMLNSVEQLQQARLIRVRYRGDKICNCLSAEGQHKYT